MKTRLLYLMLMLFFCYFADAQRRKAVALPKPTPEELEHQQKIERMTAATARVMFVDSIVVDKKDLLSCYPLTPEAGSIRLCEELLHSQKGSDYYAYVNGFADKCYYALADTDSTSNLFFSDTDNSTWTAPVRVSGLNDDNTFRHVNYPFVMGDGQTMYFAAEGTDGLGGYDIYTSTYDADGGRFLRPANIGMPFNSEANDYMYVVDEYNGLGWFATDRRQPEGKVCIYTFIPSATRQLYDANIYTQEQIASYARIDSIAATWDDPSLYRQALSKLRQLAQHKPAKAEVRIYFPINDDTTYRRLSDFRLSDNVRSYQQLTTMYNRRQKVESALQKARDYYGQARRQERQVLSSEIYAHEQELHSLNQKIHELEKNIRNTENIYLTKNH